MSNTGTRPGGPAASGATTKRKALHAYLTDEAHETWHRVAAEHGVSVSALLEAMSERLGSGDEADPAMDPIVHRARQIDAERRRR